MAKSSSEQRRCPTRVDGTEGLIAHTIGQTTCQKRQRALYHKCFLCVHKNAGPAIEPRRVAPIMELPAPPRARPQPLPSPSKKVAAAAG